MRRAYIQWIATLVLATTVTTTAFSYCPEPKSTSPAEPSAKLVLLGTAAGPIPRRTRSQPASAIQIGENVYLIDAGDGVTRQLVKAGLSPSKIKSVFLSHLHFDHTAGLAPLLGYIWLDPAVSKVGIYGPTGTSELAKSAMDYLRISENLFSAQLPKMRSIRDLADGHEFDTNSAKIIFENDDLKVTAVENSHYASVAPQQRPREMKSFSYRFDMKNKSIVFTGDTGPSNNVSNLARGADILVSEVINAEEVMSMLRHRYKVSESELRAQLAHHLEEHLSPEEVGKMAREAGVKTVVLTHIGTGINENVEDNKYVNGVKKYFSGKIIFGSDMDIIEW